MVKLRDAFIYGTLFSYFVFALQAAGISFTYMIVLIQFYLNQDLIDKYRAAFTVVLSSSSVE